MSQQTGVSWVSEAGKQYEVIRALAHAVIARKGSGDDIALILGHPLLRIAIAEMICVASYLNWQCPKLFRYFEALHPTNQAAFLGDCEKTATERWPEWKAAPEHWHIYRKLAELPRSALFNMESAFTHNRVTATTPPTTVAAQIKIHA